jgi:hypothetical protein
MKHIITLFSLFICFNAFSQQGLVLDLSEKQYKKINKKLDLRIVNRGFEGGVIIFSEKNHNYTRSYNNLWKETFFEIGVELGSEKDEGDHISTNADYYITVGTGGYSGKIYDLSDDNRVVCTFTTKEKMTIWYMGDKITKRSIEFKNYVKVIYNEILKTIK